MKLLGPARNPFEAWLRAASWYQATRRWATLLNATDASLTTKLDALRDSLAVEAEDIAIVYGQGETARHKYVASIMPLIWAEVQTASGEVISTGVGGLGQIPGPIAGAWIMGAQAAKNVWTKVWKYGKWLLGAWAFVEVGIPVIRFGVDTAKQLRNLFESDVDKAIRLHETQMELAKIRAQLIADCDGNLDCIQSVKESFDLVTPEGDCGLLDTPTGTGLGGIMGLLGGYVASEAVIGWVE